MIYCELFKQNIKRLFMNFESNMTEFCNHKMKKGEKLRRKNILEN